MHVAYIGDMYQLQSALQKQQQISNTRHVKEWTTKCAGHSLGSHEVNKPTHPQWQRQKHTVKMKNRLVRSEDRPQQTRHFYRRWAVFQRRSEITNAVI